MRSLYQVFSNTSDAVFGIDIHNRVTFWNKGCEKLLGHTAKKAIGHFCHSLLCGSDLSGNPFCRKGGCTASKQIKSSGCPADFDLIVKGQDSDPIWINIGSYRVPTTTSKKTDRRKDSVVAFFSMRRVNSSRLINRLASEARTNLNDNSVRYELTRRETEVLGLASHGFPTDKIAKQLSISPMTVRNHFKKIYSKLDAHSRSEAVGIALRNNLL